MPTNREQLVSDIRRFAKLSDDERAQCVQRTSWISRVDSETSAALLHDLLSLDADLLSGPVDVLLDAVFAHLTHGYRAGARDGSIGTIPADSRVKLAQLYRHLDAGSNARSHLLSALSAVGGREELVEFTELVVDDPPSDSRAVTVAFTPLFQPRGYDTDALFPRLLDGLAHLSAAAAIVDLANYLTREELVHEHPAAARSDRLASLLGSVAQRLELVEENPDKADDSADELSDKVNESVALAVSLCDAMALIGDRSAVGPLNQTLRLSHRRLRTEAAAALARFGEQNGVATLLELASEPFTRLRVLAYAEELGLLDKIDDEFKTNLARAESELVLWLAQPTQFGIPPTNCELVEQRGQYWPSYDEPVDCFLFRFSYDLGKAQFSNIGIVGPVTHTFTADVADLPPDDIYAAFAGWQAEHDDIYELDLGRIDDAEIARFDRRLNDAGYENGQPVKLGSFFGEKVMVVRAERDGSTGTAVIDNADIYWYSTGKGPRPLGPDEVYYIYKGRKLLRTFNE